MALFKKKMPHQVTEGSVKEHLDVMRANYREQPIKSKSLPMPLWLRLHKKDGLHVIYRDKDLLLQQGTICWAYLIQANSELFNPKNTLDLPANVMYSTHPFMESHPEYLMAIGDELTDYKNQPESEIPEAFREMARIITAETDRSAVDFTVSIPDPDHPGTMIEDVDIHFCSVIVFHKDLPESHLEGNFYPVIAAPQQTSAVLILPKEYWTLDLYAIQS